MTKIIGLTGGIGSGKTTVANYFQELGIIYCRCRKKIRISQNSLIKAAFGSAVLMKKIESTRISQIVFNDSEN